MSAVLDRFLRYVRYDTQSDEWSQNDPSTATERVLPPRRGRLPVLNQHEGR